MGRLIVSMNLSLDGCIEAKEQDDGSWLRIDDEVHRALSPREAWQCAYIEQNTIGYRKDGVCVLIGKTDSIAAEGRHRDMSLIGTGDLGLSDFQWTKSASKTYRPLSDALGDETHRLARCWI